MPRMRSCAPARQRRLQRRSIQRRRRRTAQPSRADDRCSSTSPAPAASSMSTGRPRRRRSTSGASTPIPRSSSRHRLVADRSVRDGLARTVAFYRQHLDRYLDPTAAEPAVTRRGALPFTPLVPATTAADVRAAIERVVASGWFVLGPEVEAFEAEFAARWAPSPRSASGTGTDAIALDPARARHRTRRRGHHDAAVRRVHRARGHDDRRAAGLRRHRSGATHHRSRNRSRAPSDRGPARFSRCTCTGRRPTWRRSSGIAARHVWRSSRTAARRISRPRRTSGRHDRRRRRLQLLPDEESRRARRRRRGRHERRRARRAGIRRLRNGGQTDRYHHAKPASTRGSTKCRRRCFARASRASPAGPRGGAPSPPAIVSLLAGAWRSTFGRARSGHVYHSVRRADAGHATNRPGRRTTTPRAALQASLAARGIETLIHYPVPIPRQPALAATDPGDCPVAARVCDEVLSLPLYPGLTFRTMSTRWPQRYRALSTHVFRKD